MSCYYQMFQNCTSLTTAPALPATTLADGCYKRMFQGCTNLTDVATLPATTLGESSYEEMFKGCTSLVNAPDLAATTLALTCCNYMFAGCTALTKAPVLPATTLATQCYQRMFDGCTSLVTAPELPATNLAELCYNDMFWECTSLKNAPQLPATTLADYCYTMMFLGCTSLETAPVLPAATLTPGCYEHMFMNCSKLNYVKCLATDLGDDSSTDGWMTNVAAAGTFVQAAGVDWSAKGTTEGEWGDPAVATTFIHGIPAGWTVKSGYAYTVPTSGIGTFSAADKVEVPDGLTAHYCTTYDKSEGKISVETIGDGVVPANTGVLLRGTAGETYTLMVTAADAPSIADNALVAVVDATHVDPTADDYTNFILKGGKFVKVASSAADVKISANKAYLRVLTTSLSRDAQTIGFDWDGTTSIADMLLPQPAHGTVYDLQGRKVASRSVRKGLYIVDGKKIIVK